MELCSEKNLSDICKERPMKCFGAQQGALIGVEMILALKCLHDKGYVHRDIKPSNFIIPVQQSWCNQLKIADFGLSRKYVPNKGNLESGFVGTTLYVCIKSHCKLKLSYVDDL